jgi:hypothetical protein
LEPLEDEWDCFLFECYEFWIGRVLSTHMPERMERLAATLPIVASATII